MFDVDGMSDASRSLNDVAVSLLKAARGQGAPIPVHTQLRPRPLGLQPRYLRVHAWAWPNVNYANLCIEPLQKLLYQI